MYVLDTNTVSYAMRGQGGVDVRLRSVSPVHVALPVVVVFELLAGVERSQQAVRRREQVERLAATVRILPLGVGEARVAAHLRATLEAAGTPIGPLDVLIAGIALAHGGVLVTRNVREFDRVPGLVVENWFSEP